MKDIKYNARVIQNFNDKTKLNEDGEPYLREKNEIIKDMDRARFQELQSLGYVEEVKGKSIEEPKNEWE